RHRPLASRVRRDQHLLDARLVHQLDELRRGEGVVPHRAPLEPLSELRVRVVDPVAYLARERKHRQIDRAVRGHRSDLSGFARCGQPGALPSEWNFSSCSSAGEGYARLEWLRRRSTSASASLSATGPGLTTGTPSAALIRAPASCIVVDPSTITSAPSCSSACRAVSTRRAVSCSGSGPRRFSKSGTRPAARIEAQRSQRRWVSSTFSTT